MTARPPLSPPPRSYLIIRLFLTVLIVVGVAALVALAVRHDAPTQLIDWETQLWRDIRNGLLPF